LSSKCETLNSKSTATRRRRRKEKEKDKEGRKEGRKDRRKKLGIKTKGERRFQMRKLRPDSLDTVLLA
jgi:hypothetical protein